jgi:hypothetical protein
VYVKSDRTVWAWSRRDQQWIEEQFGSPLLDVKLISGGILAVAQHRAAIFDSLLGRWLVAIDTATEALVGGESG